MANAILPILTGSVLVHDTEEGGSAIEVGPNVDEGSNYAHPVFVRAVSSRDEVVLGFSVEAAIQLRNGLDVVIQKFQKYTDD
jgi:hypothetical protein